MVACTARVFWWRFSKTKWGGLKASLDHSGQRLARNSSPGRPAFKAIRLSQQCTRYHISIEKRLSQQRAGYNISTEISMILSTDKNEGTQWVGRGQESPLCDSGSALRKGGSCARSKAVARVENTEL